MKRKKTMREGLPLAAGKGGAALALALAALWLTNLSGVGGLPTRVWRGYETLTVHADAVPPGALEEVVRRLGPGVVSGLTASVTFWNFTGIDEVPVDRLDARIDPRDPRHDRVMDALPGYFRTSGESASLAGGVDRTGEWRIAYIPARRPAAADYARIAAALGLPWHGAWRLAEFDPVMFLVSLAGLFGLAALRASAGAGDRRERRAIAVAGALLWIPFLLPGDVARLSLALLSLAAWLQAMDPFIALHGWDEKLLRESRDPLVKMLAAAGAGAALLFLAGGFSVAALLAYAGSLAASGLVVIALALLWGRARRPRRRPKKFEPVPIVGPAGRPSRPGVAGAMLVSAAILLASAICVLRSVPVPTPLAVFAARDFSWGSLARLGRETRAQQLPDISDLVTHEAFQETLSFGRPWGPPRRDERVYVREFSIDPRAGTIVPGMRRVKVFDAAWLDSVLHRTPPGSIERLLVSQRRPVAVALRGQVRSLLRELPVAMFVILLFSTWFARDLRMAPLMKSVYLRLNGAARRSQVP
ncbi:MAG: hypothetical protein ACLQDL_02895 [Spirochaetia bacterium]